jgi:hypothetical protein
MNADRVVTIQSPNELIAEADERAKPGPLDPVTPASPTSPAPAAAPTPAAPVPTSTTPPPASPASYAPPAPNAPEFRSTTPPQGYDAKARAAFYASLPAKDFEAIDFETIPWFERTTYGLELQRREAARDKRGRK